jgi:hypothetical protein
MYCAVHRLHSGVRKKRDLIDRLDLGAGGRYRLAGVAGALRYRPRLQRRLSEPFRDV